MANDLMTIKQGTFTYDFQPAEIKVNDYERLVETAEMIAKHYDNLVLTNAELSEINETHRELNSFIKGLDEDRKKVKREYNEPFEEFESKINHVTDLLKQPLQDIKDARDEILTKQEETRKEALYDYLERQLKGIEVRIGDIEIPSQWTNKGNWTDKLNPRKSLKEEIEKEIERIEEENKRKLKEREVLETFLDEKGMEHEGWTSQLEYRDAFDIIKDIQRNEERKKQDEEDKKQYEAERKRIIETEKEPVFERDFEEVEPELVTEKIEITATRKQLEEIYKYLDLNLIKFKPVIEETLDDLPW